MSSTLPPLHFNEAFLSWFRERTEAAWSRYDIITFDDYPNAEAGEMDNYDWQQGTRWLHGLSETEITSIEKRWQVTFPPDYRLFLRKLHAPDRPLAGVFKGVDGMLKLFSSPSFYNWQTDEIAIHDRYNDLVEGLVWSATEGYLPGTWERKVVPEEKRRAERTRFQELVQAAPKLIPVYSHRYLLAEPCQEGNPVFSIVGSDMIVYGASFRDYLIREFLEIIDKELSDRLHEIGEFEGTSDEAISELYEHYGITRLKDENYGNIPFWGEYLAYNFRSQYVRTWEL